MALFFSPLRVVPTYVGKSGEVSLPFLGGVLRPFPPAVFSVFVLRIALKRYLQFFKFIFV